MRKIAWWTLAVSAVLPCLAGGQGLTRDPATMKEVLSALRAQSSPPEPMHFEAIMRGQAVGFASATLTPVTGDAAKGWEYHVDMIMKLPNGPQYVNEVKSKVSESFEPHTIELRREILDPAKPKEVVVDRTTIGDKDVERSHKEGGADAVINKVPRPEGLFAFGMEFLIQRVDVEKYPKFTIHDFNPQTGTTIVQTFTATKRPDGSYLMTSQTSDGNPSYSFDFDVSGRLKSWNQQPVPLSFTRCTAERVAEIKKSLNP